MAKLNVIRALKVCELFRGATLEEMLSDVAAALESSLAQVINAKVRPGSPAVHNFAEAYARACARFMVEIADEDEAAKAPN